MERVEITKSMVGIYGMQVCAVKGTTDEEILNVCNRENPSGTTNGWGTVLREVDGHHGENPLPVQCSDFEDREHLIIFC